MIPEKLYHATYKQFLKSIQSKGLGNTRRKMWEDSKPGVVYLADDPFVAESFAEASEWLDDKEDADIYLDNIVVLEIDTTKLNLSKIKTDENVLLVQDEINATWEYHDIISWEVCKVISLEDFKFAEEFEALVESSLDAKIASANEHKQERVPIETHREEKDR